MNDANAARLAELQKQYAAGIVSAETRDGKLLAFRCPSLEEWEEYQEKLAKEGRAVAFRQLVQVTCVHPPDLDSLKDFFAKQPASIVNLANGIAELAGADLEATVKKG